MRASRIDQIIKDTLDTDLLPWSMTSADHMLVALTFHAETALGEKPPAPSTHGLMAMSTEDLEWLVVGFIRPRRELSEWVSTQAQVEVRSSLVRLCEAAEYNIAWQVCLVYLWYLFKNHHKPLTVNESIRLYQDHWDGVNQRKSTAHLGEVLASYRMLARDTE